MERIDDPAMLIRMTLQIAADAMSVEIGKLAPKIMGEKGYTIDEIKTDPKKMDEVMRSVHTEFLKTDAHSNNEILWETLLLRLRALMTENEAIGFYAIAGQMSLKNPMPRSEILNFVKKWGSADQTDTQSSSSESGKS